MTRDTFRSALIGAIDIGMLVVVLALVYLLGALLISKGLPSDSGSPGSAPQAAASPAAFAIISGPQEIGHSDVWVLEHRETRERFVYVERGGGAMVLTPLKPAAP